MAHSYTEQGCRVPLFPASPQELLRLKCKILCYHRHTEAWWLFLSFCGAGQSCTNQPGWGRTKPVLSLQTLT